MIVWPAYVEIWWLGFHDTRPNRVPHKISVGPGTTYFRDSVLVKADEPVGHVEHETKFFHDFSFGQQLYRFPLAWR
jgi:hypothetical protein